MTKKFRTAIRWLQSDNSKSTIENTKWVGILTFVITIAFCGVVRAQPAKTPRVGLLYGVSANSAADRVDAFRQGLRELGYVEGKNVLLDIGLRTANWIAFPPLSRISCVSE